jgi:protein phosphatase PTC1
LKGGSTAAVVTVADGYVTVCNAGDARVVAGLRGGGARRLTVDHKASTEAEAKRIREAGGFIVKGRLCAMIAVTRGLGDFDFEDSGMTCEPFLDSVPISEVEFLVVASDGLWDIVDDEQCCSLVRSWGRQDTLAHRLARNARIGGTDDDVTVIVVWLDSSCSQNASQSSTAE